MEDFLLAYETDGWWLCMFERVRMDLNCFCLFIPHMDIWEMGDHCRQGSDHAEFIFPVGRQIISKQSNRKTI